MTLHLPQQIEIIDFIAAFGLYLCLCFLISYYIHGSRTKGLMNLNFSGCPIKLIILHNSVYSLKSTASSLLFFLPAFLLKWSLYSGLLLVRTFNFVLTKVLTNKLSWGSIHRLCTSLMKLESTESLRNATEYTVLTCLNPFCLLHRLHFLQASSETQQTRQALLTLKNGNIFFLSQCMRTGSLALIVTKGETHYAIKSFLPSCLSEYWSLVPE